MAQQNPVGPVRLPPHLQPRPKAAATASSSDSSSEGLHEEASSQKNGKPDLLNQRPRTASPSQFRRSGVRASDSSFNSGSSDTAHAYTTSLSSSRAASRARSRSPQVTKRSARSQSSKPASAAVESINTTDEATEAFIRRVLCPYSHSALTGKHALDELLPPLTSSNEIDLQLYAILAIVIKEFVASWYAKITPDQTFVEEMVRIIAHCTRDLEQRLRRLNVASLVFDEIPTLIQNHATAFRAASRPQQPHQLASEPRTTYHTLRPHPAFAPVPSSGQPALEQEQVANESYYRQLLVYGALAVLLPTEDLQSPPLRILVADVLGEMILGRGIGQRACECWLLWDGIIKAVASVKRRIYKATEFDEVQASPRSRLERFGLLAEDSEVARAVQGRRQRSSMSLRLWQALQFMYTAYLGIHFLVVGLAAAATRPAKRNSLRTAPTASTSPVQEASEDFDREESPMATRMEAPGLVASSRPILSYAVWDLVGELIDLRARAPWTSGLLAFARWHLTQPIGWLRGVGARNGILDKFLDSLITTHVLTTSHIPSALLQIRLALFPNNRLGPARVIPSPEEQLAIRRQAAESILSLVPGPVARRFLDSTLRRPADYPVSHGHSSTDGARTHRSVSPDPMASRQSSVGPATQKSQPGGAIASSPLAASMTIDDIDAESVHVAGTRTAKAAKASHLDVNGHDEAMIQDVEEILDIFSDSYMNKHMIFGIVELLFVRLMPELEEKGVRELLEERGVAV